MDPMKTRSFQRLSVMFAAVTALALVTDNVLAQNSTTSAPAGPAPSAAVSQPAPQLPYGVPEVLQLTQAKVGDSVIINYIQNSGNNYGLNASQIIYLRQQGVSEAVINAMLTQRAATAQPTMTTAPPSAAPSASTSGTPDTGNAQPSAPAGQSSVSYVPATTASTVYVVPNTQTYYYSYPYYYPYYYGWPAVSLSFGWGWGGYYHGGYWGGYHGGWHGGGGHGGGGGWHH